MNFFQFLGLALLALLAIVTIWAVVRGSMRRRVATLWLMVWTSAAGAIAMPNLTMVVAHALGIGRGADLVFYCATLAIMVGFFLLFARIRRLDENMTRLVRHLAIQEAMEPETIDPTAEKSS